MMSDTREDVDEMSASYSSLQSNLVKSDGNVGAKEIDQHHQIATLDDEEVHMSQDRAEYHEGNEELQRVMEVVKKIDNRLLRIVQVVLSLIVIITSAVNISHSEDRHHGSVLGLIAGLLHAIMAGLELSNAAASFMTRKHVAITDASALLISLSAVSILITSMGVVGEIGGDLVFLVLSLAGCTFVVGVTSMKAAHAYYMQDQSKVDDALTSTDQGEALQAIERNVFVRAIQAACALSIIICAFPLKLLFSIILGSFALVQACCVLYFVKVNYLALARLSAYGDTTLILINIMSIVGLFGAIGTTEISGYFLGNLVLSILLLILQAFNLISSLRLTWNEHLLPNQDEQTARIHELENRIRALEVRLNNQV